MRKHRSLLTACMVLGGALGIAGQTPGPTLKKVTEFGLPGPAGNRFDYLTIDADDNYLI